MSGEEHGWQLLGGTTDGGTIHFAPVVLERHRCICDHTLPTFGGFTFTCSLRATQEDRLCDLCRERHRSGAGGVSSEGRTDTG